MYTIAVFMGTRPEGIKMAPVIRALRGTSEYDVLVVNTGQHEEMMEQVVSLFGLHVDRNLRVMKPDQSLAELTARLVTRLDGLLEDSHVDLALVQGDTTTVLAAALACFYRRIPLGHVEAGLRTGDIWSPFPEEANRTLASKLVELHFAPTEWARENLRSEGIEESKVFVTGNTVIDALHLEIARQKEPEVRRKIDTRLVDLLDQDWRSDPLVLITGHRRESFGAGFRRICEAIAQLAGIFPDHQFVYPVHLNPNVQAPVHELLAGVTNVALVHPLPYAEFVALLHACQLVLTDSGGVQEEAPGLGKPVLVMRDTTERPEGVKAGVVELVGTDPDRIVNAARRLLTDPDHYRRMSEAINPYGDGRAAERITAAIRAFFDR